MLSCDLIEKYKPYIITPHKNSIELLDYLKNKVDCTEIDLFAEDVFLKKLMVESATYSILNTEGKTESDFQFKHFFVEPSQRNEPYYQEMNRELETVYVIIEMQTGYVFSNCQKLLLELLVEQGIDVEDLEAGNTLCKCYLHYIQSYLESINKNF